LTRFEQKGDFIIPAQKTFLGFGLGAVQSGLMLHEAIKSGNFKRYVILEVNDDLVKVIQDANCTININTATENGIIKSKISGFEIYNPQNVTDRRNIESAISEADEMATAIPSIDYYDHGGENSIANLLARNINPDKPQIIYTAENNNYASDILLDKIIAHVGGKKPKKFQTLNTVIGKMGGVIQDPVTINELGLALQVPDGQNAILVEEFNNIIVSKVLLKGVKKGIDVFQEKEDLLPFEEAKLFGHNAVHSMLGFLAYFKNYLFMSDIRNDSFLYQYGEIAFREECGALLLKKYKNFDDPLFTKAGFEFYGSDLLKRMTNPYLRDEVKRICRDPLRKIGYNDRFLGTIQEAFKQNIIAKTIAQAVIGGLCYIINEKINIGIDYPGNLFDLNTKTIKTILEEVWKNEEDNGYKNDCLALICSEFSEFSSNFLK
jgi:mannitol-1-phosphate 5-dehydrogenase